VCEILSWFISAAHSRSSHLYGPLEAPDRWRYLPTDQQTPSDPSRLIGLVLLHEKYYFVQCLASFMYAVTNTIDYVGTPFYACHSKRRSFNEFALRVVAPYNPEASLGRYVNR
jgi:hypothetical protein